ncbi:MAG: glycosyltransferase [Sphingosinicella sp.]|nr:glycosyltransferase [Sphingosinicella sp.]
MTGEIRADLIWTAQAITWVVLASGFVQNLLQIIQLCIAAATLHRRPPVVDPMLLWQRYNEIAPPVTLIAPAFNEETTIVSSVRSMLSLRYPDYEIIIVNDGSSDGTLALLKREFGLVADNPFHEPLLVHQPIRAIYRSTLCPRLQVVDKLNGGKADAQNAAVNLCSTPLFCVLDGDTLLEQDALLRAVQPFIDDPERMIAVGGSLRIANGSPIRDGQVRQVEVPHKLLPRIQIVEYLRSFLMARVAWSQINSLMIISGAFGLFRKDVVMEVGGYLAGSMGEDLDIVIRLHRHMRDTNRAYRIGFVPEPMCWTEVPETLSVLARQRARWQNGALDCFFRYRGMALNPRYGRVGMLGFGQMIVVDLMGPLVEVLGYFTIPLFWAFGVLSYESFAAYVALVFGIGMFVSIASLLLAEMQLRPYPRPLHLLELGSAAILENFGYRQLHNFWRLRGYWQYLRSSREWGEMPRVGFAET